MLKVWFLNVGHGDCTLVEHPSGRLTMVDINNSTSFDPITEAEVLLEEAAFQTASVAMERLAEVARVELADPVDFLHANYPGRPLHRFVLTHPDLDHMRGLGRLLDEVRVLNFWDTANTKDVTSFKSSADRADWAAYQRLRQGGQAKVLRYTRGADAYAFSRDEDGGVGGDGIEVLSPTPALLAASDRRSRWNDLSLVLRVSYAGTTLLLPGDVEAPAWADMVAHYGAGLKSTVLKASHHGRDSGYDLAALRAIDPAVVVVSVGRKPGTDAQAKYAYHCAKAWSTRYYGNLCLTVAQDGKRNWTAQRNGGRSS